MDALCQSAELMKVLDQSAALVRRGDAIEQAKGIIMTQQRCGPTEAFDLLRQASRRTNIKLHVLAGQIVEHVASTDNRGNVTLIPLGAAQHLQAGTLAQPPAG